MKGVYKIVCIVNDIIYIGSTTVSFIKRFKKHKQKLRYNYHENTYLQNMWNKYGSNNFKFEIVENLDNATNAEIRDRELFWINKYFPLGKNFCFNLTDCVAGGNTI